MHFENQKPQLTHCYQVTNLTYALMVTLCYGNIFFFFFFSCIYFLATSHEYVADGSRCAIPCCVFRMADKRNCQLYARCHQPARQTGQFSPRRTMRPGEFVVAWPRGHHRQPLSPCHSEWAPKSCCQWWCIEIFLGQKLDAPNSAWLMHWAGCACLSSGCVLTLV